MGVRWRLSKSQLPFQGEADFQRHLPIRDVPFLQITARLGNLKPAHVADGLFCPGKCILNRVFDSVRRGTDQLDLFVNVVAHRVHFSRARAEDKYFVEYPTPPSTLPI